MGIENKEPGEKRDEIGDAMSFDLEEILKSDENPNVRDSKEVTEKSKEKLETPEKK